MSTLMRIMMSSENYPHNKMTLINIKINDMNIGIYNLEEVYSHKSLSKKTGYPSVFLFSIYPMPNRLIRKSYPF